MPSRGQSYCHVPPPTPPPAEISLIDKEKKLAGFLRFIQQLSFDYSSIAPFSSA